VTCIQKAGGKTEMKDAENGKEHVKWLRPFDTYSAVVAKRNKSRKKYSSSAMKTAAFYSTLSKIRLDDRASC